MNHIRRFKLSNSLGNEFNLMRHDAIFHSPAGLGLSHVYETIDAGREKIIVAQKPEVLPVTGRISFLGYKQYNEFVAFCSHKPLKLWYCPIDEWQYKDVVLGKIEKNEKPLDCPVEFTSLGPWYRRVPTFQIVSDATNAKRYPYKYPYRYPSGRVGSSTVINRGTDYAPMRLYIFGPCDTPSWELNQNGKEVGSGKALMNVRDNEVLIIDSRTTDEEMGLYKASTLEFIRPATQYSDWLTTRFIEAPPGESMITVTHAGNTPIKANGEVFEIYV